ncbi:hypothetical protein VW23_027845 [Devosia insulae DS-56]|uniref:Plasmid stabilization protein n=1 Tax=Devosia insulae DS-56 TaxID=1116389 RepID=A0A1E5XK28_9HYPH|nr:hypothetical protein VW23_027845 [Devosia insulae DS-56]
MPSRELQLTSATHDDLRRLAKYIIESAGMPATAAAYVRRIEERCADLCDFPAVGRNLSDVRAGLRVLPFEGVVIVFETTSTVVRVLRIYGQRQNYERHLRHQHRRR